MRPLEPGPCRPRRRRHPRSVALRALLGSVLAGPLVGAAWWAASLGGLRGRGETYLELLQSVGDGDAGFALACLLAGAAAGTWWVAVRERQHDERSVARLAGLLVGGLLGAVLAWLTGRLLSDGFPVQVPGVAADVVAGLARPRPGLAAVAGALLWPLAVGVLVAVDTLRELAWQWFTSDDGPGREA